MGFEVSQNAKLCYDGKPAAQKIQLNQPKSGWNKHKGVSVLDLGFGGSIKMIFNNIKYLGVFAVYFSVLVMLVYLFYLFNLWQIRLDNNQKAKDER